MVVTATDVQQEKKMKKELLLRKKLELLKNNLQNSENELQKKIKEITKFHLYIIIQLMNGLKER